MPCTCPTSYSRSWGLRERARCRRQRGSVERVDVWIYLAVGVGVLIAINVLFLLIAAARTSHED